MHLPPAQEHDPGVDFSASGSTGDGAVASASADQNPENKGWLTSIRRRATFVLTRGALVAAALAAALVVVEGLSSVAIFTIELLFFREEPHSIVAAEYDPQLGWAHIPNFYDPDLYGPGVYFQSNSEGFRNSEEFAEQAPAGTERIICVGDSFTEGLGVSNDQTWCNLLRSKNPDFETINMGVGGYGIDQAYLFYRQKTENLEHDIVLFAFIMNDFARLSYTRYVGYYKPTLRVEGGELLVENVPVPRPSPSYRFERWFATNRGIFMGLRSMNLGNRVVRRLGPEDAVAGQSTTTFADLDAKTRPLAMEVFEAVAESARLKGARPLFVYLPATVLELRRRQGPRHIWQRAEELRRYLDAGLSKRNLEFVDVFSGFRQLDDDRLRGMFDNYTGHYSVAGNEYVAHLVTEYLRSQAAAPSLQPATDRAVQLDQP